MESFSPTNAGQVDAVEQQHQVAVRDRQMIRLVDRVGQLKRPRLEPLVPQGVPVAVPVQQLKSVAAAVAEQEQGSAQRVLSEVLIHQSREPVKALSHVGRLEVCKNPQGRSRRQHDLVLKQSKTVLNCAASTVPETRTSVLSGSSISSEAVAA